MYAKTDIDALLQKVLQDKTSYILKNLGSLKDLPVISKIDSSNINTDDKYFITRPSIEDNFHPNFFIKINESLDQNQKIDDL